MGTHEKGPLSGPLTQPTEPTMTPLHYTRSVVILEPGLKFEALD